MKNLTFVSGTETVLQHVPSLGVLKFATDKLVNELCAERGKLCINAVRKSETAMCLDHYTIEIFFTTGFKDDFNNPTLCYAYSFETDGDTICNIAGMKTLDFSTPMHYFVMHSEDKIFTKK